MEQIGHSASDAHALTHDRSIYSVASFNSILDSSLILLYGLWFPVAVVVHDVEFQLCCVRLRDVRRDCALGLCE
jgi:hypothetical protein